MVPAVGSQVDAAKIEGGSNSHQPAVLLSIIKLDQAGPQREKRVWAQLRLSLQAPLTASREPTNPPAFAGCSDSDCCLIDTRSLL